MAIIEGVTVDWRSSPRIITVPSPLTEITITDLQDTLLDIEDSDEGILWPHLRNTAGGEDLGGGVFVSLTMELQNAKLAFEARGGPDYVACVVSGGNLVAVDDVGDSADPIQPTDYTQVTIAQSASATSLDTDSLSLVKFLALQE